MKAELNPTPEVMEAKSAIIDTPQEQLFPTKQKNVVGILGFVFSIIAFLTSVLPALLIKCDDLIIKIVLYAVIALEVTGLILNIVSITRKPKGFSIAGFVFIALAILVTAAYIVLEKMCLIQYLILFM